MIYTTYFSKVNKLPKDVVPIAISQYVPKGVSMARFLPLAPSKNILFRYKEDNDWDLYVRDFNKEILDTLNPKETYDQLRLLADGKDFALVCYEKDRTHCHRSLVGDWFEKAGMKVIEFGTVMEKEEEREER